MMHRSSKKSARDSSAPADATQPESARQLYHNLIRMMAFLHRGFNPAEACRELSSEPSYPQFKTLMVLRHVGPCTMKELSSHLGSSMAATSEMVNRLVEQNLVDRSRDKADRRRVRLTLTSGAEAGVERIEDRIVARLALLMKQLGEQRSQDCAAMFSDLASRFEQIEQQLETEQSPS